MKNYVELLDEKDCTKLLSETFRKDAEIQICDPDLETKGDVKKLKYGLIINDQLRFGEAYFGNFHYEVLLRYPNSIHGETMTVKKPYAMYMMDKIRARNAAGDNTFNADDYVYDYNKYLEQDFDKQIQEVEKEYYDNVIYFKDKQFTQEKGE